MPRKRISLMLIAIVLFAVCVIIQYIPFVSALVIPVISIVLDCMRNNLGYVTPSDPILFMLVKSLALYLVIGVPVMIVLWVMRR